MTNRELLTKIDRNAAAIRAYRPLSESEIRELDAYYKIGTTYSSNALEGNSLTISETKVLLEDGITVGGKPIRDCYEATGHAKAYDYMQNPLQFIAEQWPSNMSELFDMDGQIGEAIMDAGKNAADQQETEQAIPPEEKPHMQAEKPSILSDLSDKKREAGQRSMAASKVKGGEAR